MSLPFRQTSRFIFFAGLVILLLSRSFLCAQNDTLESGIASLNRIGCVIADSAIKITGTGSVHSNKALFNCETTLDEIDVNFRIQVDSLDASGDLFFAIGKYSGIAGTMIEFVGTDSTSVIRVNKLNILTPTFITQFVLPFVLEEGENYNIRVGKRVRSLVIEVISADSANVFYNDSLSYPVPFFGCLWGTPFVGCKAGTIYVRDFSLSTPLNKTPRLVVWGDSFSEGNSLPVAEQRFVSLIQDSIGHQNVTISARGGEASTTIHTRFYGELKWFTDSKYALVQIGVNDNNFSNWRNNMLVYLDTLKKSNIIPIIATLSPRADRLPFIAQVNNWIRTVYDGAYIDVSKAVSVSGTTWATGMGMTDSIHPTPAGHIAIYERIQLEAPYLFRENDPYTIDYFNEITYEAVNSYHEYSNATSFVTSTVGATLAIPVIPGETLFFRDTMDIPEINSIYHILPAPERPAAPTGPTVGGGVFDWTNNPAFLNASDYEFSTDAGSTWTTCVSKPLTVPGYSSILVRVKATATRFKSIPLLIEDIFIGIASAEQRTDVLVFPNPVVDRLTIKNIFEETELTIYAADGRAIKTILLENETNEINTEELSNGFYIFALRNKSMQKNFKILKK